VRVAEVSDVGLIYLRTRIRRNLRIMCESSVDCR